MKKSYIIVLLYSIISFGLKAQKPITIEKKLLDSSAMKLSYKTYILMENDSFILFTPSKYFIEPFTIWVKDHPQLLDDKRLLKAIEKDTAKRLVKANKIAIEYNLNPRLNTQIGECLKIGRCIIYNKTTQLLEKKIIIQDYLVGNYAEVRYKVNNSLLFIVND